MYGRRTSDQCDKNSPGLSRVGRKLLFFFWWLLLKKHIGICSETSLTLRSKGRPDRIWRLSAFLQCRHHMVHVSAQHQRAGKQLFISFPLHLSATRALLFRFRSLFKSRVTEQLFLVPLTSGQTFLPPICWDWDAVQQECVLFFFLLSSFVSYIIAIHGPGSVKTLHVFFASHG